MTRFIALIPARGGSKGLPGKNIADLGGKPLIAWTIAASLGATHIARTIVSSDDGAILARARDYGAEALTRPAALATDAAMSESVVAHALEELAGRGERADYLVLLQPTSPLRTAEHIDAACAELRARDATGLISVCAIDNKILKAFRQDQDGFIAGVANNDYPFMRRQDLPPTWLSNGAIYIVRVDEFIQKQTFLTDRTIPFVMDPAASLDIDVAGDLKKAAAILADRGAG